jgi:hypothetical protein
MTPLSIASIATVTWLASSPSVDPDRASLDPDRYSQPIDRVSVDPDRASRDPDRFSHDFEAPVNPVDWGGYYPYPPPPWAYSYSFERPGYRSYPYGFYRSPQDPRFRFYRYHRFHDFRPYYSYPFGRYYHGPGPWYHWRDREFRPGRPNPYRRYW